MDGRFVKIPNLPGQRAVLCAAQDIAEILEELNKLGIKCISFRSGKLSEELSGHSDMLLCHLGEDKIYIEPTQTEICDFLKKEGFSLSFSSPLGSKYPENVKLNVAVSDKFFIFNEKSADKKLIRELNEKGKTPIAVKQGYSKCSVCFINEDAAITEDISISNALKEKNIDVLVVSKGDIFLSDKHYGFFGGASGKIDKDTLAVTGRLSYHADGEKILSFALAHGVNIIELTSGRLKDIGGILPLKEKTDSGKLFPVK